MQQRKKRIFYIIITVVIILVLIFLYTFIGKLAKIFSPFFMAIIIAYLIKPFVLRLQKHHINAGVSILLVYLFFIFITGITVIFLVPELINNIRDLINTLPSITEDYKGMFDNLLSWIRSSKWPPEVKNAIFEQIQNGISIAQGFVGNSLKKALDMLIETVTIIYNLTLAAFIAYYLVKDGQKIRDKALSLTPRKWRDKLTKTGRDINKVMSSFIQGQLLDAFIVGILETIGLIIAGVKYPVVLGLVGGLSNIIPYFGPFIGVIPALAVSLTQSITKAVITIAIFVGVQQLDSSFISSKIIEGKLGMHPLTTIIVVLIGGEFFGIVGMLIAVPVAAIIKIIIKRIVEEIV